jgi:hypothetical protein
MRLQCLAVGCHHGFLPRLDEAIQTRLAKDRPDALDQIDSEVSVRVRVPGVAVRGQPPHPFRTTDFARLVLESNQALAMKLCEMLSHADFGDAEGVRESVRTPRTARFKRVEKLIAVV